MGQGQCPNAFQRAKWAVGAEETHMLAPVLSSSALTTTSKVDRFPFADTETEAQTDYLAQGSAIG